MMTIDLKLGKLFKNRREGWIAVSSDFRKVLARDKKLSEVVKKTKKRKDLYYLPVAKNLRGFIGGA